MSPYSSRTSACLNVLDAWILVAKTTSSSFGDEDGVRNLVPLPGIVRRPVCPARCGSGFCGLKWNAYTSPVRCFFPRSASLVDRNILRFGIFTLYLASCNSSIAFLDATRTAGVVSRLGDDQLASQQAPSESLRLDSQSFGEDEPAAGPSRLRQGHESGNCERQRDGIDVAVLVALMAEHDCGGEARECRQGRHQVPGNGRPGRMPASEGEEVG